MKKIIIFIFLISIAFNPILKAQDTLVFKGQFSSWLHFNPDNDLNIWAGARYLPQVNYQIQFDKNQLLDFELSANITGSLGSNLNDSPFTDAQISPYRAWMRYSGTKFEIRAGLQKINFGSATILRPLMWFDEVDARDPLKFTNGVWGLLGRYYFLNNANVWAWVLYGNNKARGWEFAERNKHYPEFGGRMQFPIANSEIGLTYHHQILDTRSIANLVTPIDYVPENKFGLDIKIDWHIGLWVEGVYAVKNANLGSFTNQEMITTGFDYTFGIGNGLYVVAEHLIAANDENAFEFKQPIHFTASSLNYPVGLFDNVNLIFYYDWANKSVYNFINWQRQFNKFDLHLMAYWNPKNSTLPTAGGGNNLYGGKGIQLMLIINH